MKHVQQRNSRFVWRLNILGEVIRNIDENDKEVTYSTPVRAGYDADLCKFFIREFYNLRSSKTELSLPPEKFSEMAAQAGLDLSDLKAVFHAMPGPANEWCMNASDLLKLQGERASRVVPAGNSNYLKTLLDALPSRLNDALKILQKAGQLLALSDETKSALSAMEMELSDLDVKFRVEIERILQTRASSSICLPVDSSK